jgi:RNA polymerase sigma-70 factor (ECF subfamily)
LAKHPNINGFVFLTAKNHCLDIIKKKKKFVISDVPIEAEADKVNGEDKEFVNQKYIKIKAIIEGLPDQQKEVIVFRDIDGLEFEEISEITGYKKEHIRVILSRARKMVREQYEKAKVYEQRTIK